MRPRSHATTTAGVRLSSAAIESGVSPRRRRVAISSSGVTTEAWPPRHNPAKPPKPGSEHLSLACRLDARLWCRRGARRSPHDTVLSAGPRCGEATTTANPAKAGGAKLRRLTRIPDLPDRHASPAAERSDREGSPCGQRILTLTTRGRRIRPPRRWRAVRHHRPWPPSTSRPPSAPQWPRATDALSLRDAVRVFVEVCRGTGDPPERALIAVKERVLDALRRGQYAKG